mgnify:CR=1 FL=1
MKFSSFGLAILAVALYGGDAGAHVVLDKSEARIGRSYKAVLAVPHGCDGSATVRLTVQVPEGLVAIKPMPKPGWTIEIKKGAYARAYDFMHGIKLSEGVKEISWSGRLEDSFYDEFTFTGFVADTFKGGEVLAIPAIQDCEKGTTKWVEMAAPGQDPHALKYPAPLLRLTVAPGQHERSEIDMARGQPSGDTGRAGRQRERRLRDEAFRLALQLVAERLDRRLGGRRADQHAVAAGAVHLLDDEIAEMVEIHEMSTRDGVMVMRPLEQGLPIPPGQTVALTSGGYHLMLTGLKAPLVEGKSVVVTLQFERAGKMAVLLDVLGLGAQAPVSRAQAARRNMRIIEGR